MCPFGLKYGGASTASPQIITRHKTTLQNRKK